MALDMLNGEFSWEMIGDIEKGRSNLGGMLPVEVYRLLQYTMRSVLVKHYGADTTIELFRECGHMAGKEFAENMLDLSLELNPFIAQLQSKLKDLEIGILRFEAFDPGTGKATITVSEDLDCSGLPVMGECVCNYDEGFIAGILSTYTKLPYQALEIDCWAKGDRVCRFEAEPKE